MAKEYSEFDFKDLHIFILALLTKSTWRVEVNSLDLWVPALKGFYFPDKDFEEATLGRKPC